uniref:Uncharacterized protein n=1 Tax=Anguilla anguilla TaxID=7936 RepID=A0A0E9QWL1_ANGAN
MYMQKYKEAPKCRSQKS